MRLLGVNRAIEPTSTVWTATLLLALSACSLPTAPAPERSVVVIGLDRSDSTQVGSRCAQLAGLLDRELSALEGAPQGSAVEVSVLATGTGASPTPIQVGEVKLGAEAVNAFDPSKDRWATARAERDALVERCRRVVVPADATPLVELVQMAALDLDARCAPTAPAGPCRRRALILASDGAETVDRRVRRALRRRRGASALEPIPLPSGVDFELCGLADSTEGLSARRLRDVWKELVPQVALRATCPMAATKEVLRDG